MAEPITMPKLGMAMVEGTVVMWLQEDGAEVTKGTPVVEVETEKSSFQVVAPVDGILRHVAKAGDVLPVGDPIAYLTQAVDEVAAVAASLAEKGGMASDVKAMPSQSASGNGAALASPATRRLAREKNVDLKLVSGTGPEGRVTEEDVLRFVMEQASSTSDSAAPSAPMATPVARVIAAQAGLNLAEILGSGPRGKITEKDVQQFIEGRQQAVYEASKPSARSLPLSGVRRMTVLETMESLQMTVQVTAAREVDVTEIVRLRDQLKERFKLAYTAIFVKAVAAALKQHPLLNAVLVGDEVRLLGECHIGVAVSLEDRGLIVPVVHNADKLSLREIAEETARLAQGAREGTLKPEDVQGSTFTLTDAGMFDCDVGTLIPNTPGVGILSTGRIIQKPVVVSGEVAIRSMMWLSVTHDHRIVDGAPAMRFVQTLAESMAAPYLFLS